MCVFLELPEAAFVCFSEYVTSSVYKKNNFDQKWMQFMKNMVYEVRIEVFEDVVATSEHSEQMEPS